MGKSDIIKWPSHATLKARTSTISNAFVQSFTPWITELSSDEEKEILDLYKKCGLIDENESKLEKCAYCGAKASTADHFHPLVKNGEATGYITEIYNLIPCCGECNSTKGNTPFDEWYKNEKTKDEIKQRSGWSDDEFFERKKNIENLTEKLDTNGHSEKIKKLYEGTLKENLAAIYEQRKIINDSLNEAHKLCLNLYDNIMWQSNLWSDGEFLFNKLKRFLEEFRNIDNFGKDISDDDKDKVQDEFLRYVCNLQDKKFCKDNFSIDTALLKKSSKGIYYKKYHKPGNKNDTRECVYCDVSLFDNFEDDSIDKIVKCINKWSSALYKEIQNT